MGIQYCEQGIRIDEPGKSETMKFFRLVWKDIRSGQNIDVYITVFIAIAVAIFGVIGIADLTVIASATLAILALVSVNLLSNRRENENIRELLEKQEQSGGLAKRFLKPKYMLFEAKQFLIGSRKAFFWGADFARTIPLLDYEIGQALQAGTEIKFLIIKPNGSVPSIAVQMAAFRHTSNGADEINSDIERNFRYLASYASSTSIGKVEVRVVDYLAPWTIIAIDPLLQTGKMFVHLTPFRVPNEVRPSFELAFKEDTEWFNFFVEQFESVWSVAEPVNLESYKKSRKQ
jgi:hypothetical protein